MYRRYRPETFAEMIGQSQVTDPLMTALRTNRVNHAYLFSGPRGCGKTTSARILARCLNCAEGPTDTPCGVCPSCVELSRDGSGSLDVVEIDAASHNGVDDARDIRERAIFAPARDRYKIFILDEAHMVTPQGFNALLKIVEEPPEHVKFIFATTEPDKVIGTIRSRTHHYPFRLVPPAQMLEYVQEMCEKEGVQVAPGVLPLVVRAGGGSPRDTLSLLDQLMAGSVDNSVEYERAVALLGYTHAALLDEAIDAIATRDSSAAFDAVDRVIQTGQDPRRFVEDLLERMRDLIVVAATSVSAAAAVLRGVPQDDIDRMAVQASKFGAAELSRTADILNSALTEMSGATSPRLHLELMIARVLIPASDDSTRGALARVERLERRIGVDGVPAAGSADATDVARATGAFGSSGSGTVPAPVQAAPVQPAPDPARASAPVQAAHTAPGVVTTGTNAPNGPIPPVLATAVPAAAAATGPTATPEAPAAMRTAPKPVGPVTLQQIKDAWPEILEAVKTAKLSAWLVVLTASVLELRNDDILVMSFPSDGDVTSFKQKQPTSSGVSDYLRTAIVDVLGLRVKFIVGSDAGAAATRRPVEGAASGGPLPTPTVDGSAGASAPAASVPVASAPAPNSARSGPTPVGATGGRDTRAAAAAAATAGAGSWATVAIPGSGASTAPAEVAPAATAAATSDAPAAAQSGSMPADRSAPPVYSGPHSDSVPPFDDEPPPFDDDVPPETEPPTDRFVAPDSNESLSQRSAPSTSAAASGPDLSQAPSGVPTQAPRQTTPRASAPTFGEKQRYGESVVREILGATFLEEQPHNSAPRPRGD
nr:DNA polymerase III subunit gamma and tau [Leifsonia psychrotolerans]